MVDSNHGALGQGLKYFTDAMRPLIKERLMKAYPNNWWEMGVMGQLTEQQRRNLKTSIDKDSKKDRLEHVDALIFPRIVSRNFDGAFHGVFSDFNKTQSLLMQIASARNEWAHPRTGDMLADDVAHALYAMVQILNEAHLPVSVDIERIRKDVIGIRQESRPDVKLPVTTAPSIPIGTNSGQIPYWWEVCEPQDAFKNPATIDESVFAATLGGVHAGSARREYLDTETFLSHTYFTENLKQTIRDVASRMQGGDGPAITEMQTPFGGGKTHALLTLYHLVRNSKKALAVAGVSEALGDISFPNNAKVLVFDGNEYGTEPTDKDSGDTVFTLWGELAFQADRDVFRRLVSQSDSRGDAPGNALFRKVLEAAAPCLILIDELVSYLVKLRFSNARKTENLYRQTIQFLQELFQEAGNVKGICLLVSLPKSTREFGGLEPEEIQRQLAVIPDLQARTDRVVSKRTPVNDEEIYTLMSKRLFKRADPSAALRVARQYRETYERTRGLYDPGVFTAEYLNQQVAAYPIHPELIDVLYKKWSTASDFPRTRAVLQLLASIVADQWVNRREAYSIHSSHVNLERERIRTRIVSAAGGGGGYDAVVAADIIGGEAHADILDQKRGNSYLRHHVSRGVATTVLMHSFGGAARMGALPWEVRLGIVAPNVGPEYVTEVVDTLEQSLWYVHREGDRLRFQTRPNVYRVIARTAEEQPAATVTERLREVLGNAVGKEDQFRLLEWAGSDSTISDRPDTSIAVMDAKYAVSQESPGVITGRERLDQIWDKSGGGLRQWRNALILVTPDRDLWKKAEESMREVMGYESVIAQANKGGIELTQIEMRDLNSRFNSKRESVRTSVVTAYRWVFYPDDSGLSALSLPIPATKDDRIVPRLVTRLSDQDYGQPKILRKVSAVYFNSKLVPRVWKEDSKPLELGDLSRRFPQWTYLPMLIEREGALRACVKEGVSQKLWAIVVGDNLTMKYQKLIETAEELDGLGSIFDGSVSLIRGQLLDLVKAQFHPKSTEGSLAGGGQAALPVSPKRPDRQATIPAPVKRLKSVRLTIQAVNIAKTGNLQPYLFKVLQEHDAGAELNLVIEVNSGAGIPEDVIRERIVQGLEQLGLSVSLE